MNNSKIFFDVIQTPLGEMIAYASENALFYLSFVDMHSSSNSAIKNACKSSTSPILNSIASELERYFNGALKEFKTPIALRGTSFQQAVWQSLQKIEYGTTTSYASIAGKIGNSLAFRAVAQANRSNKLSIIVPCHRVIKSNGELCGYNGRVDRKKWLIDFEQHIMNAR